MRDCADGREHKDESKLKCEIKCADKIGLVSKQEYMTQKSEILKGVGGVVWWHTH